MFNKLDINDFFDEKYEKLNHASGIGGMGFITSKQAFHLYNPVGLDKKTNTEYLGIGDHIEVTNEVLKELYGTSYDYHLYDLISIKYWNAEIFKIIAFYFPKNITLDEYEYLTELRNYYKDVFEQYKITVAAYEFGNNVIEYGPDVETKSNLEPIIDYARDRLSFDLVRDKKEKILRIN